MQGLAFAKTCIDLVYLIFEKNCSQQENVIEVEVT